MMYEYALDPEVFSSGDRARWIAGLFGLKTGRLVAPFPQDWNKRILGAETDLERKQISFYLEKMVKKNAFFRNHGRARYDPAQPWLENARREDRNRPFRSIITTMGDDGKCLDVNELDEDDRLMCVNTEKTVPRTPKDMAEAAAPLLRLSREIHFVDPHFNPGERRYQSPLREFLLAATAEKTLRVEAFHYHLLGPAGNNNKPAYDFFRSKCDQHIRRLLPHGTSITFHRWSEMEDSIHARYILTEIAGISYEHGLDSESERQTTDVKLLTGDVYAVRRRQYHPESTAFRKVDCHTVET